MPPPESTSASMAQPSFRSNQAARRRSSAELATTWTPACRAARNRSRSTCGPNPRVRPENPSSRPRSSAATSARLTTTCVGFSAASAVPSSSGATTRYGTARRVRWASIRLRNRRSATTASTFMPRHPSPGQPSSRIHPTPPKARGLLACAWAPAAQGAAPAGGPPRMAHLPAVQDEPVVGPRPFPPRNDAGEVGLGAVGVLGVAPPQAVGHPEDVSVDGQGVLTECVRQHHIGRFSPHAGKLHELRLGDAAGKLPTVALQYQTGRSRQIARLRPVKAAVTDEVSNLLLALG